MEVREFILVQVWEVPGIQRLGVMVGMAGMGELVEVFILILLYMPAMGAGVEMEDLAILEVAVEVGGSVEMAELETGPWEWVVMAARAEAVGMEDLEVAGEVVDMVVLEGVFRV